MDFYKPFCKNITVPLWARWERSGYLKYIKEISGKEYQPVSDRIDEQTSQLAAIIQHAYANCPFYKEHFDGHGVGPGDFTDTASLKKFPILTKTLVKNNSKRMIDPNIPLYRKYATSGSTGIPLEGWLDQECSDYKRAAAIRSQMWSGYNLGDRIFSVYGNPEEEMEGFNKILSYIRRRFLERTTILDMLRMDETSILAFFDKMKRLHPSMLWGHTHGLYLISLVAIKHNVQFSQLSGIFTAGMPLYEKERQSIEKAFSCKVFNRYGCEELSVIASECDKHEGLHMNTDNMFFEFLDSNGDEVPLGSPGQIVVTDLRNKAMPLIRYKLNDVCVPSESPCSCGRTMPLIARIEGRTADFLISASNQLVSGISLTDHFSCNVPGLDQVQFVQNELKSINLRIVKGSDFDAASEKQIAELMAHFFGADMGYQLEFLDVIPQEPNGKYRFTICNVEHELFK